MDLDGWGWVLMTLGMIAFWAILIFAFLWILRGLGGQPVASASDPGEASSDPVAILDRRLAEGDISIEEHRARRQALGASSE